MKNYIHQQDREQFYNPGGIPGALSDGTIPAGTVVVILTAGEAASGQPDPGRIGIAIDDIPLDATGELQVGGVVALPFTAGLYMTQGSPCTWVPAKNSVYGGAPSFASITAGVSQDTTALAGRVVDFSPGAGDTVANVSLNQH